MNVKIIIMKKIFIFGLILMSIGLLSGQVIADHKLYANGLIPSVCVTDDEGVNYFV